MCSTIVDAVREAVAALEKALAEDPHLVADETLCRLLPEVQRARNLLDSLDTTLVGHFDGRRLGDADGLTTTQWLTHRTGVPADDARARIRCATALRRLPHTSAAYVAGRVGKAQVLELLRLHGGRTATALEEGEHYLIEHAVAEDFATFVQILRAWKHAADPDGPEPKEPRRGLYLRRGVDGDWEGRLLSPAEQGIALDAALARFEQLEWERDWAEARAVHGEHATVHHLRRTPAERRHDALIALAMRGAGNPEGTREPRPLVTVVVTQAAFERALAEAAELPVEPIDPADAAEYACRLADGTPIERHRMLRLAIDGFVQRVVMAAPSVVTDVSKRQRLFRGPLRHALLSIVPWCTFPGCSTPAARCEVDHRTRWRHGGVTEPANGASLCDRHQKLKERGFTDRCRPDGTWTWHRPDGTRLE